MTELEPPPGTHIWLANIEYCAETITRHSRFGVNPELPEEVNYGHMTSLLYGNLGLYVIGLAKQDQLELIFSKTIAALESLDTLRIWPNSRSAHWPQNTIPIEVAKRLTGFQMPAEVEDLSPGAFFED